MNYESELMDILKKRLKEQYGIQKESILYVYFQLRYKIWKMRKKDCFLSDIRYQIEFLLSELNLPKEEGRFRYKGEWILTSFSLENSLQNMMEAWSFEQSIKEITNDKGLSKAVEDYVEEEWKDIQRKAKNKAKRFKSTDNYDYFLQKYALDELNDAFHATPTSPTEIKHVFYPSDHHFFIRTMEEELHMYIHSLEMNRKDTLTIEEKDVEAFLIRHLDKIEEGLRFIDHQFSIKDGRIDILAKDKNKQYVIIELKVQDDKELIWQCVYYPEAFKEQMNVHTVRMITLSPTYSPSILTALKQLSHVEIMTFSPSVSLQQIKDIKITPIS